MQCKVMVLQLLVPATEMSQCGHSVDFCTWEVFMQTLEPVSIHLLMAVLRKSHQWRYYLVLERVCRICPMCKSIRQVLMVTDVN